MPDRIKSVDKLDKMVGVALAGLGADPEKAASGPHTWVVGKQSAAVVVRIVPQQDPERPPHLQLVSPVMKAAKAPALRDRLLELNYEMGGLASFCLAPNGEVQLMCSRTTEGLTAPEIAHLIAQVAHFSDLYDNKLLEEFGRDLALRTEQRAPPKRAPAEDAPGKAGKGQGR